MSEKAIAFSIFCMAIFIGVMLLGFAKMYENGYKQGQIDAKAGKWKIVEVTTKEWVEAK